MFYRDYFIASNFKLDYLMAMIVIIINWIRDLVNLNFTIIFSVHLNHKIPKFSD